MAEKKDCANCKYDDKMPFELPCNGCFYQDRFNNWEPIPTPTDKVEGGKEGVDEEAIRIRDLFWYDRDSFIQRDEAKKSALTHCDLMIDAFKRHDPNYHTMSYWHPIDHYENLKAAINKL